MTRYLCYNLCLHLETTKHFLLSCMRLASAQFMVVFDLQCINKYCGALQFYDSNLPLVRRNVTVTENKFNFSILQLNYIQTYSLA